LTQGPLAAAPSGLCGRPGRHWRSLEIQKLVSRNG
jgi:hypothetical protein